MECPHLSDDVKIDRLFVRNKVSSRGCGGASSGGGRRIKSSWKCLECSSEKENWMCLNCGKILCGRYVNSHALQHSDNTLGLAHKLCMNTLNQAVYCYTCDDFVINETAQLDELRQELVQAGGDDDDDNDQQLTEEVATTHTPTTSSSSSSASSQNMGEEMTINSNSNGGSSNKPTTTTTPRPPSTGDSSGVWTDDVVLPQTLSGRRLRPRKRTISSDSSNHENSKESVSSSSSSSATATTATTTTVATPAKRSKSTAATRRAVGLRNLGNTCFMNSVLQSLSNIQEFSSYFYTLPSMEQIKQQRKKAASGGGGGGYVSSSHGVNGTSSSSLGWSSRELEEANVVEELRKVLLSLGQGGDGSKAISPECLFLVIWKVVPQFRGHRQHDAHEFLRYMLDRLHTELQQNAFHTGSGGGKMGGSLMGSVTNGSGGGGCSSSGSNGGEASGGGYGGSKRSSIVTNVFGGVLQSEVRCLICGMDSKKHDPFLDLSLDIPERFYSKEAAAAATAANSSDEAKPECHIWDCLSSFTEVEELAETELYYCNSCKCKQKSTKRFWIRRLPNVLCLHIKRFRWSNFFRTKIDLRISFPIKELDMSQFVLNNGPETRRSNSSNNVYDLAAVIVHHGNGSSCGHYTSYAHTSGTWLHFNDHTVKEVPYSTVADCKPYILFYTRRDANSKPTSSPTSTTTTT